MRVGGERRAAPRFRVPEGSYVWFPEGTATIVDLALGGVKFRDPDPLPVGTRLDLRLHVRDEIVPAAGEVCRAVPGRGAVVRFTELPRAEEDRLRGVLSGLPRV